MKRALRAGLPLVAALAMAGCFATQKDMLDLENQTDELKHQVTDLKQTVNSMQANQADLMVQFKRLHEDLSTFTETMRQSQNDMSRLSSKLDDLAATITNKVAAIGTTLTTAQAKSLDEQKAALATQLQQGTPSELFQTAEVRLSKKSYDLAAKGFADYIARFPKGALFDMAIFNLGEAYYGMRRWEAAGQQYALYLEKYPKNNLTATARIMYALCLINMRKSLPEARQYLESVVADFPSRPEAKAAALHLKKLAPQEGDAHKKTAP